MSPFIKIIFVCSIFALTGCSTTSSYIPLKSVSARPAGCPLQVFMPGQRIDKDFEVVGTFSVQEAGLSTNCEWVDTLAKNKKFACANGAEAIQFLEVDTPSIQSRSTCYTSKANFIIFK